MAQITLHDKRGLLNNEAEIILTDKSIADFIVERYYNNDVPFLVMHEGKDITFDSDSLLNGFGEYTVIETPSGLETVFYAAQLVLFQKAVGLLVPLPKIPKNIGNLQESPNNSLSNRSNQARLLQRIPDVNGAVRSVPDIITPHYYRYSVNRKIQYGFYCIGRKKLMVEDVRESDTPINLIVGSGANVYFPHYDPFHGSAPDLTFGESFTEPMYGVYSINDIDGIRLPKSATATESGSAILANYDYIMVVSGSTTTLYLKFTYDAYAAFAAIYSVGDYVTIGKHQISLLVPDEFQGNFKIKGITHDVTTTYNIYLDVERYTTEADGTYTFPATYFAYIYKTKMPYSEWYYMTRDVCDTVLINISALNGLTSGYIVYDVEIEGIDYTGLADGVVTTDTITLTADGDNRVAISQEIALPTQKRFRVRVRNDESSPNDAVVMLENIYGLKVIDSTDIGDYTLIQTKTEVNEQATAIKERQLNCLATEMLYVYSTGTGFAGTLTENTSAAQSFITAAVDPRIGGLSIADIDADGILDLEDEINAYFSDARYSEFNYTLDSTDITFQDHAKLLFNSLNSIPYRENNQIKAIFERPQSVPKMLFTHRSKIPNTETYSRNFNLSQLNDGVELKYFDAISKMWETLYLPTDKSAIKPKKIELVGVNYSDVALVRANREFNKIKYRKADLTFDSTVDGMYVKPNDMIAVVKGSRTRTQDGEVVAYDAGTKTLTLSQPVTFTSGDDHVIVLKTATGTASYDVTAGATDYEVVSSTSVSGLYFTDGYNRQTEYSFCNEARVDSEKWLAQEVDISDKWQIKIKAINYSDEYYADDL